MLDQNQQMHPAISASHSGGWTNFQPKNARRRHGFHGHNSKVSDHAPGLRRGAKFGWARRATSESLDSTISELLTGDTSSFPVLTSVPSK